MEINEIEVGGLYYGIHNNFKSYYYILSIGFGKWHQVGPGGKPEISIQFIEALKGFGKFDHFIFYEKDDVRLEGDVNKINGSKMPKLLQKRFIKYIYEKKE
jgi:hypothetical protein